MEIYFHDLNKEIQKALLKAAGINSPEEANWDVFPIGCLYVELTEDNE